MNLPSINFFAHLKLVAFFPIVLAALISSEVSSAQASTTTILIGHSQKCLDVQNGDPANNVPINQYQCDNSQEQQFSFKNIGNGYYNIISASTGKCIEVPNGSTEDYVGINQYQCDNSNRQAFSLELVGNGYYKIIASHSRKCLDVPSGSTNDTIQIQQLSCDGQHKQMFYMLPASLSNQQQQQRVNSQSVSPDAKYLNDAVGMVRRSVGTTEDIFEMTKASSSCPSGCDKSSKVNAIEVNLRLPRHTSYDMSSDNVKSRLKKHMISNYCATNDFITRRIYLRWSVQYMNGSSATRLQLKPEDCKNNASSNSRTNSNNQQPQQRQPQMIAHYPLRSNAEDSVNQGNPMLLKGLVFNRDALYSFGIYKDSTAEIFPKNMNLNRFEISAQFYVNNDMENKSRPVFITGSRWLGFYLDKNGTVSMKYNNSNYVTSNVAYNFNQWHTASTIYENGTAYFYLDGVLAGSVRVNFDFVNSNPRPSIGITDYSNGATFKGWIRELTVRNR
jgi:hypothetical protein